MSNGKTGPQEFSACFIGNDPIWAISYKSLTWMKPCHFWDPDSLTLHSLPKNWGLTNRQEVGRCINCLYPTLWIMFVPILPPKKRTRGTCKPIQAAVFKANAPPIPKPPTTMRSRGKPSTCPKKPRLVVNIPLLLIERIRPNQLIGSLSQYSQGFIHPRYCWIFSINSI